MSAAGTQPLLAPDAPSRMRGTAPASRRTRTGRGALVLAVAAVVLLAAVALSLAVGSRTIDPATVLRALLTPGGDVDTTVVRDVRVPRTLIGLLAGGALALAGTLMQGLTRNPLADPGLLGISTGASLAVVLGLSVFGITQTSGSIWLALAGAAVGTAIVYGVSSTGREGATPVKLALAGAAVTAVFGSIVTVVLLTDQQTLDQFRFWSIGSLTTRGTSDVLTVLPFALVGAVIALALARPLDALALGDDSARGLGVHLTRTRLLAGLAVLLLCGSATAVAGPLLFVGLAVPHIARRLLGPGHRLLLPASLLIGPALLLAADVVGRVIVSPAELQAGLLTAALGAPVLIGLARGIGSGAGARRSDARSAR